MSRWGRLVEMKTIRESQIEVLEIKKPTIPEMNYLDKLITAEEKNSVNVNIHHEVIQTETQRKKIE